MTGVQTCALPISRNHAQTSQNISVCADRRAVDRKLRFLVCIKFATRRRAQLCRRHRRTVEYVHIHPRRFKCGRHSPCPAARAEHKRGFDPVPPTDEITVERVHEPAAIGIFRRTVARTHHVHRAECRRTDIPPDIELERLSDEKTVAFGEKPLYCFKIGRRPKYPRCRKLFRRPSRRRSRRAPRATRYSLYRSRVPKFYTPITSSKNRG